MRSLKCNNFVDKHSLTQWIRLSLLMLSFILMMVVESNLYVFFIVIKRRSLESH